MRAACAGPGEDSSQEERAASALTLPASVVICELQSTSCVLTLASGAALDLHRLQPELSSHRKQLSIQVRCCRNLEWHLLCSADGAS